MNDTTSQIKNRPWWYIGLIRSNDDPPLKLIVHWICIGLIIYGVFIAYGTHSAFSGWNPPQYSELIPVNGVLEYKSAGKTFSIMVRDVSTGIPYYSLGYRFCREDFGKQAQILGYGNTIYEIRVNNVLKSSYSEYVSVSKTYLPRGIKVAVSGVVLYIIYFIFSLRGNRRGQPLTRDKSKKAEG